MTTREQALRTIQQSLLPQIKNLYAIEPNDLHLYPDYEGCQNLVFFFNKLTIDYVLRVSYRSDRSPEQIHAELDFVRFLYEHGVRVSPPIESREGRYVEVLTADNCQLVCVVFVKAPGHRLPDRGYKYRVGKSIDEYFTNWGRILGQMHRVSQEFIPECVSRTRPQLVDLYSDNYIHHCLPPTQNAVKRRFLDLLTHIKTFSTERTAYGLIHADFNDGNFCVDYTNGSITAFDFDDSAYCWFMYDLASAWRSGVGWVMAKEDPGKRRDFMYKYFDTLLKGYTRECSLSEAWLDQLPTFLKLIEMESVLGRFREAALNGFNSEYDGAMLYQLKCIENDIPFFGFFDSIYSPEYPFQLPCHK